MYSVQPFLNLDNIHHLAEFFRSCLGPKGSYKMFVTSAGQVRVTRLSSRIVASILSEIKDPCAEAILHLMKSHLSKSLDFGLSLGSLTCDLILSNNSEICFETATKFLQTILQEEKIKIDICNIKHLMALVRSTGSQFCKHEFLGLRIIEAFIQSIPDSIYSDPGQVDIRVETAKDFTASIQKGFFYSMPEIQCKSELRWSHPNGQPAKILLANLQLKVSK